MSNAAMNTLEIPLEEFFDSWGASSGNDVDYLTYDEVKDQPVNSVWSVVEGDDESLTAIPGFHVVNMIGYITTTKQWDDERLWCLLFDGKMD